MLVWSAGCRERGGGDQGRPDLSKLPKKLERPLLADAKRRYTEIKQLKFENFYELLIHLILIKSCNKGREPIFFFSHASNAAGLVGGAPGNI